MITITDILVYVAAYVLGSIPFSVIVGKVFYKTDVRQHGSGNPGATNTLRTLGTKAGLGVLALDMAKGLAAVLLAKYFTIWPALTTIDRMTIGGALAICGHIFSPFLGFKGGKGVATTIGVIIALEPWFAIIVMASFIVILLLSKYVSLASIISAFVFTLLTLFLRAGMYIPMMFGIGITLLIVIKHRANISRLLQGRENRFAFKKTGGETI